MQYAPKKTPFQPKKIAVFSMYATLVYVYLRPPELYHKPPLIAPQHPPNCTETPKKNTIKTPEMYQKTPRNVPKPPQNVLKTPKSVPKNPPPNAKKTPQNVQKKPHTTPKKVPNPPPGGGGGFWHILGCFFAHFSWGVFWYILSQKGGAFSYKVGVFVVFTSCSPSTCRYCAVLYCTALCCGVLCCAVPYCTLYCTKGGVVAQCAERKVGYFPPPVATGPRVLNSAPHAVLNDHVCFCRWVVFRGVHRNNPFGTATQVKWDMAQKITETAPTVALTKALLSQEGGGGPLVLEFHHGPGCSKKHQYCTGMHRQNDAACTHTHTVPINSDRTLNMDT